MLPYQNNKRFEGFKSQFSDVLRVLAEVQLLIDYIPPAQYLKHDSTSITIGCYLIVNKIVTRILQPTQERSQ